MNIEVNPIHADPGTLFYFSRVLFLRMSNYTMVMEFSKLFLLIYLAAVLGNLLLITLTSLAQYLYTLMYSFF